MGNRRSVVESDFYTKLKKIDVQEGKENRLFADHVAQVCEEHDRVIPSFLLQGQTQRDRERRLGTMCMCKEMSGGTHAHRVSKLGPSNEIGIRVADWEVVVGTTI